MNYNVKPTAAGFVRRSIRPTRTSVLLAAICIAAPLCAGAAQIDVEVHGRDHKPIPEVVVTVTPLTPVARTAADHKRKTAVMSQINRSFSPQVLVVGTGTWVEFPNNDVVSHQVYSFSAAKRFQLALYKGDKTSPILFDQAGLVVLGCNIHDNMVGYIYVTDAPGFGKTNSAGEFSATDLPPGKYRVEIWSPRVADADASLSRVIDVAVDVPARVEFQLQSALRSSPEPRPHPAGWDSY